MSFWKINSSNKPEKVPVTKLKNESLLEKHLEDWVESNPEILGEKLLVIGRQIIIPEVKDKLDLLGLDSYGNATIIELKRGKLSDPVDMQALRYASYISKWKYEDFESQAKAYFGKGEDFSFTELFENFCRNVGVEEIPDINNSQRIIIAGSEVKDKLGSVALWLSEQGINIKIIEIDSYKEGETLLLQPKIIIPHAVNKFSEVGKASKGDISKPWLHTGRTWHLEKRMKLPIREIYLKLEKMIHENITTESPSYEQKNYISFKVGNYIWLAVNTFPSQLVLSLSVKKESIVKSEIAKSLGIEEFDSEDELSEKLNLPTSINVKRRNETSDRILLRIKEDFNIEKPEFINFLKETLKNASKGH